MRIEFLQAGERLDYLWPQIKVLFDRCIREACHDEITVEDVYDLVVNQRAYLFAETDSRDQVTVAIAFELIPFPRFTAANVFVLGGHGLIAARNRWWEMLLEWLKGMGVSAIDAWVGEQMERVLKKKLKFKTIYRHMRLEL